MRTTGGRPESYYVHSVPFILNFFSFIDSRERGSGGRKRGRDSSM